MAASSNTSTTIAWKSDHWLNRPWFVHQQNPILLNDRRELDVVQMSETTDSEWGMDRLGDDRYLNSQNRT